MKPDAVVFDLHGTLIPWSRDGFQGMLREAAAALGIDGERLGQAMRETAEASMAGLFPTVAELFRHICSNLAVDADPDNIRQAERLWWEFHWQGYERPYPGAVELLGRLRADGVRLGVITNCGAEAPDLWRRSRFAPLMDCAVFSVSEGLLKPDRRMYELACARLAAAPARCLYVDDSVECLIGAERVGMNPLLIRHPGNTLGFAEAGRWVGASVSSLSEVPGTVPRR